MNQAIIFNDDLNFNKAERAWSFSGLYAGQLVTVFFHCAQLNQLNELATCTQYDLEEITELWLKNNEPEKNELHIYLEDFSIF